MTETWRRGGALIAWVGLVGIACADGDNPRPPGASNGGSTNSRAGANGQAAGSPVDSAGQASGATNGGSTAGVPEAGVAGDLVTAGTPAEGGASGAGGEGGASEPQCAVGALGFCDDGNPCTEDSCDAQSGCFHEPLANGTPCDDSNACTSNDACVASVCEGQPQKSDARVLGSTQTFGAFLAGGETYQGLSAVLSDTRVVFAEPLADGLAIRLVGVFGDELRLLSEVTSQSLLQTNLAGLIGDEMLQTQLVPLTDSRFALFAAGVRLELFDVVADQIVPSSSLKLQSDPRLDGVVGFGDLLYACNDRLETFDVSAGVTPKRIAALDIPYFCTDVALSSDRTQLYVATTRNVRVLSLQDPRKPVLLDDTIRAGHYYTNVAASQGHLALLEDVFLQVTGDAMVLDAASAKELRVFPSVDGTSIPLSIGFVNGSLQLVSQRFSGQQREIVAESYDLGVNGPQKLAERSLRAYTAMENDGLQGFDATTRAGSALSVVFPTRQVLRSTQGALSELRGSQQGNLSRVVSAGPGQVAAYGSSSTHLIDISNPLQPHISSGGLTTSPTGALWLQLSHSSSAPQLLNVPTPYDPVPIKAGSATVAQFSQDAAVSANGAPQLVGTFQIASGRAQRSVASGLLFELSLDPSNPTLRTTDLPRAPTTGKLVAPFESQQLTLPQTLSRAFAVDATARALVLAHVDKADPTHVNLDWLERAASTASWHATATLSLPAVASGSAFVASVFVQQDVAIVVSGDDRRVDIVERTAGGLSARAFRDFQAEMATSPFVDRTIGNVLGVDGDTLYLRTVVREDAWQRARVLALRLSDLTTLAEYSLPQHPTSMTTDDGYLIFGMPSHVTVASPACAATP